jgi:predicted nucleic acid-binding protein
MESPSLGLAASLVKGLVVDSSVLITAERGTITTPDVIRNLRQTAGDGPIVISALTVAELGHGIYHAGTEAKARNRRRFLDELKQHVPIHPITAATAEIIARVGGEQAVKGITTPFADLIIGACALELNYAVATHNARHFQLIPGLVVKRV